jgi:Sec-independent protein translocase protein TatA
MDSFFGIGFPELVVILLLAGLVMGPHHIRQVARTLGRLVAQMQTISREFARQLNAELDALDSEEVRGTMEDMKALRREVDELRRQVRSIPQELGDEGRRAVDEGKRAFEPVSRDAPSEAIDTGADGAPPVVSPDSLPEPLEVGGDPE